jgi:hypothetical protein
MGRQILHGGLGTSIFTNQLVAAMIAQRIAPTDLESLVQVSPMDFDEGADAAIRIGATPLTIAKIENSKTCGS